MALMGDTDIARRAGIHAEIRTVMRHSREEAISPVGLMTSRITSLLYTPVIKVNESRRQKKVTPIPRHPASAPSGIAIAQSTRASNKTAPPS